MNKRLLKEILEQFDIPTEAEVFGNGHINDTYVVANNKYILQRINTTVFSQIDILMTNIEHVTSYLKNKIASEGGNPERETLTLIPTKEGKNYYKADEQNVFRVYQFVENTKTIENGRSLQELYEAGAGFGKFHKMMENFPIEALAEVIKDFHHTPRRIELLQEAVRNDIAGRVAGVNKEIEFALDNISWTNVVVNGIKNGNIPLRVTHNDTKINNILFDKETGKAVCVIDLDTVMPGSILYDFGDALRMGASTAAEDEVDLEQVWFDVAAFEAFARGYLSKMQTSLTKEEVKLLPLSAKLMTYECGIRFLTDYLNGDVYYKIQHEHHNLDRARNQFKLVKDIADKEEMLEKIVERILTNDKV